jgi:hypothetical protein
MTNKRYKVRFNLGRGENYMKWKVVDPKGVTSYYFPTGVQLRMTGCTLKNNKAAAKRIYRGESNKVVCAWVLCEKLDIITEHFSQSDTQPDAYRLKFNPRTAPNWQHEQGEHILNADDEYFNEITTVDYRLYITKE